jgi:outer membrane protein assembly factor BamB
MRLKTTIAVLVGGLGCGLVQAQSSGPAAQSGPTAVVPTPGRAPAVLPGKGLAQHDFVYSGESHDRKIFIVRGGKVVWSYDDPAGKGEISDMVMLSNGNILFAHQFGLTEIAPDKSVVWNYVPPAGHEVHTAVPIGNDRVLYVENADPNAVLRVVNIRTGAVEKEFPLQVKHPVAVHPQFRHVRLTPQGTLLVAHMDLGKVVEYDSDGHELWSFPAPGAWSANPLANGNVLITDRLGVREVTRRGDSVWSWMPADAPGYKFASLQNAWRLKNGDTVINNWVNEWTKNGDNAPGAAQAIEVTPDKKVVWALREWGTGADSSANLGPATSIQFLDQGDAPAEDVHFGDIR